jgi:hypothetical protein
VDATQRSCSSSPMIFHPSNYPRVPPPKKHRDLVSSPNRAESLRAMGAGREISPHREHLSPAAPLVAGEGRQGAEQARGVSMGIEAALVSTSSWSGTRHAGLEPRRVREEGQANSSSAAGQHHQERELQLHRGPTRPDELERHGGGWWLAQGERRGIGEEMERRKKERERRADRWALPSCGIHVSKSTIKTGQWPNMNGFKSWVAKDL